MITREEYEKGLSIVKQYIDEQKILISEVENLYEEDKHPIAEKGDYIEITNSHTTGFSNYLKIGIKLRVASMWGRGKLVLCRCSISGRKGYLLFNSRNYDWKIINKKC